MFHVVFFHPEIPGNTGNAIRMVAGSGCTLHLIEPLGFSLDEARLRRAGLDYHEFATVRVHADRAACWADIQPTRVFAFTTRAKRRYTDVAYEPGDVLLFGPESVGLPAETLDDPMLTDEVWLPQLPSIRSLNLANSAAIAVYEAWRQQGFAGA